MNKLKHAFILKNRIIKNASDLQLWSIYLRSGTSQLNEGHYNIGHIVTIGQRKSNNT